MESVEHWISENNYSLFTEELNQHIITGYVSINLKNTFLNVPYKGLLYKHNKRKETCDQPEFLFTIDWSSYLPVGEASTAFYGRKFYENDLPYIDLEWLLTYRINHDKLQETAISGKSKLTKSQRRNNKIVFLDYSHMAPHPFHDNPNIMKNWIHQSID